MSEKFAVVQGAICSCQFGSASDQLKVNSHQKEYANDPEGAEKLIATTKELGTATFENNSFGSCSQMGNPPPPCKVNVTQWQGFYEKVTLSNGGKVLLEDSKAICAIAGTPCISIEWHGQIMELAEQNFKNVNTDIHSQLNPLVDLNELMQDEEESWIDNDNNK
ncbi:DUF4280 domain-containing protein [Apibacter muscae]|uniref:DUF4280 domain-containing protein n=1 Tax=Apibacter muscae TaxID=2509004 RepID=UPI0011ABF936|nr:DUF4280 domain-containing protein [Apibacter muscae]TWP31053.1 DUF4280 domain-containing protein [Apibacter muscae]